jgi:hypothetical protein
LYLPPSRLFVALSEGKNLEEVKRMNDESQLLQPVKQLRFQKLERQTGSSYRLSACTFHLSPRY